MLLIQDRCDATVPAGERLVLAFELRQKSRLRTRVESGEEAALFLERGAVLRGGDKLVAEDGRIVEVVAAAQRLLVVCSTDAQHLARAAYHLGNRHIPVEVGADTLRLEYDHVLEAMLRGLSVTLSESYGPFEPEAGAYGGGHRHAELGEAYAPNISELIAQKRAPK